MSRRKPSPLVEMSFEMEWNPRQYLLSLDDEPLADNILDCVLCLTGYGEEAVATTVLDYFQQTWPVTGSYMLNLVKNLVPDTGSDTFKGKFYH